ncbi:nuclear pore complex protein Nup50-like [Ptychodera flava]|uniref:nuclear pore complex protein Nup50-like n=1 Tax=Ptychodera flava TaxID=63121 RepID=UPI003969BE1B
MAKRTAERQLTDRNWDQEEPKEEAGSYVVASEDQLAKRQIKKAKRRVGMATDDTNVASPEAVFKPFTGFAGFTSSKTSTLTSLSDFKALTTTSNGTASNTKPLVAVQSTISTAPTNFKPLVTQSTSETKVTPFKVDDSKTPKISSAGKLSYTSEYWKQLKNLNQSVSEWIQKHVKETPLCDLTPVFRDYEKHLKVLETKYPPSSSDSEVEKSQEELPNKIEVHTSSISSDIGTPGSTSSTGFTFQSKMTEDSGSSISLNPSITAKTAFSATSFPSAQKSESFKDFPSSKFSFSTKSTEAVNTGSKTGFQFSTDKKEFSFKQNPLTGSLGSDVSKSTFSFGLTKPHSNPEQQSTDAKDDEDCEVPKVEVKEVQENDALFSVRCKLFVKKDGSFVDKGVGMLHLKRTANVLQMLIRADTNLGNILLNIGIPASLPFTKQGKNNVMLIAAPNPPIYKACPECGEKYSNPQESNVCNNGCQAKAMPILIRVKTSEMADELLQQVEKLKKSD